MPVTNNDLIHNAFARTTVLEALFIEMLGVVSLHFEDEPGFRGSLFQTVRERLRQTFADPKSAGEAAYAELALKIADQIEEIAITRLGGGARQS